VSAAHVYLGSVGWLTDRECTEDRRIAEVVLIFDIQMLIQEVLAENGF